MINRLFLFKNGQQKSLSRVASSIKKGLTQEDYLYNSIISFIQENITVFVFYREIFSRSGMNIYYRESSCVMEFQYLEI